MKIFGIDPGSDRTGYGCVETDGSRHRIVCCGAITTRVDGTKVWETGGGNYGTSAGAPLSGFAALVLGTLGPREGAVAMNSLASPTGYLDLAERAITAAARPSRLTTSPARWRGACCGGWSRGAAT